jgi:ribose transport system permease protein
MDKTVRNRKINLDFKTAFPYLGLAVILIFFGVMTGGKLFSERSLYSILNESVYMLVAAVGLLFIISQGGLDLSIGANMAVGCAAAALGARIHPLLALPAGMFASATIGFVIATLSVKCGIRSFIVTLAMQFVCNGLVLVLLSDGVIAAPLEMLNWYSTPFKITILAVFLVGGYFVFEHTRYGKTCRAIGSGLEAVRHCGINTDRMRTLPFVVMGAIVGLLGFVSLTRTGTASNSTGSSLMMNALNAVLLGGVPLTGGATSRFRSVIIGSLAMLFMSLGMSLVGWESMVQQIVKGLIFLTAVSISFNRKNVRIIK